MFTEGLLSRKLNNVPPFAQRSQTLTPGAKNANLFGKRDFAHVIKDLKMQGLSYIIQVGPKYSWEYPCKKQAEGDLLSRHTEEKVT